jgi:hypothetical protein
MPDQRSVNCGPDEPNLSTHPAHLLNNVIHPRWPSCQWQSLSTCHRDENFAVPARDLFADTHGRINVLEAEKRN